MKNIIIFGASRAGKTSLAKRLKDEFQFNVVNVDHLVNTFEEAFPNLGIGVEVDETQATTNFTPFIAHYICELASHVYHKTGSKFVVDMTFFDFDLGIPIIENRLQRKGKELLDVFIFVGLINNKTSEELFNDVRKYDMPGDWTLNINDNELREHCDKHAGISESKSHVGWQFYGKREEFDIRIYDTAEGRKQVFDRIINDLSKRSNIINDNY